MFFLEKCYNYNGDDMQKEQTSQNVTLFDEMFADFKEDLTNDLNIDEPLNDEELKQILIAIIKEYENEFYNDFTDIFVYTYYKNLLNSNNNTMNKILNFTKSKKILDNTGKEDVLKSERADCNDVLYLYSFDYVKSSEENKFVSKITGKEFPIGYPVAEIIDNNDVFFRPPKGNPGLRGPHITFSIEYDYNYWLKFKENIAKYIENFEKIHSKDFLEDLEDYRFWLTKYRILYTFLKQENLVCYLKGGERHVKN